MKFKNRVLLSCITASMISSGMFADSCSRNIVTIDDVNTTGVVLKICEDLDITAEGSIQITNDTNDTYVKAVDFNDSNANITNSGTITVNSQGDITKNYGVYGYYGYYANITNSGTINVGSEGNSTGNYGISGYYSDITNSGTISINSEGKNNSNIGLCGGYSNIANSGTITINSIGQRTKNYGIYGYDSDITNSGTITVGESSASIGIFAIDSNVTNSGTINVNATALHAFGIYERNDKDSNISVINTASGTITASEAIDINGIGTSLIKNQGTINTSLISSWSSTLINSGTINLHNFTIHRYHNSPLTKSGFIKTKIFNQTSTGTLSIDANLTDDGHNGVSVRNSAVRAMDSATLDDGSTINVNVISERAGITQRFLDQNGTVKHIITAQREIDTNTTKLNITDNLPVLDFEAFMDDTNTTLNLKVVKAKTIAPKDKPLAAASTPTIGMEILNTLGAVVQARQNDMRGLGSGDMAFKDKHMWFKPFGMYTKQDNKDGINGFDANTYGFGMGIDGEYKEGRRAGFAFFYSNTSLDINDVIQTDDMNVFNLVAYGSNPVADDKTMLFYQAGAGVQKNNAKRYVTANSKTAKADYTSQSYYIQAKVTRDYGINDKLMITPAIKGALRYFKAPSYTESGAGVLNNMSVDSVSTTQVLLGLAANMKYKINDKTNFISNVTLDYDFNNDAQSVSGYYQGIPFNTSGIKNSALSYGLGLGISRELKKNLVLNLKYSLNGRGNDFINHSIQAKFRWRF